MLSTSFLLQEVSRHHREKTLNPDGWAGERDAMGCVQAWRKGWWPKASWLTPALELTVQGLNPACMRAWCGSSNSSAYAGQESLYLGDVDDRVFSGGP